MAKTTIHDVAREAGVSIATVSYVLNDTGSVALQTRERVRAVARRLNYSPSVTARNLQASKTHLFGYSWRPAPPDSFNPILDQFLRAMAESAAHHDYRLIIFPTETVEDEVAAYRSLLGEQRLDGIVLSNTNFDDLRVRELLRQEFPFVAFGRANEEWTFPWVDVDGHAGTHAATSHLLAQGHERITCLGWPQGSLAGHHRLSGFRAAIAEAGLPLTDASVVRAHNFQEAARETIRPLLAAPAEERPTAVVAVSDLMAMGVMNAAEDVGLRVGVDLAVVGFDDSPVARFLRPPLSSVAQPIEEVGEALITLLVGLCSGEPAEVSQILLPPRLIVRESSAQTLRRSP